MRKAIALVATLVLLAVATVAIASDQFTDVGDGNIFHDDIGWMSDNGITFGYGDGTYGPTDNVTRGQMAAFMHRLYDRVQEDIPNLDDPEVINEIAQIVNIESVCEVFGFEPGSQECEDGLAEILEGPQGPQGEPGVDGENGADGVDGVSGLEADEHYTGGTNPSVAPGGTHTFYAECPEGKYVLSGGWQAEQGDATGIRILESSPSVNPDHFEVIPGDPEGSIVSTAWQVRVHNDGEDGFNLNPWSVCANITS